MARGRKPKLENKKRKKRSLSFNDDEWKKIGELADQANMSKSEFARKAAFRKTITSQVDENTFKELHKIGVNLNQIAKVMNKNDRPVAEGKLKKLVKKINNKMDGLI